MFLTKLQETKN